MYCQSQTQAHLCLGLCSPLIVVAMFIIYEYFTHTDIAYIEVKKGGVAFIPEEIVVRGMANISFVSFTKGYCSVHKY